MPEDSPSPAGKALCPSATCKDGALLLGIVQKDATIGFLPEKMPIDSKFTAIAHEGRAPEKRFRFADKCVQSGCKQWTGTRCGVIDSLLNLNQNVPSAQRLPNCSIRPECRWFSQNGAKACALCPLVITDLQEDQPASPTVTPVETTGSPAGA